MYIPRMQHAGIYPREYVYIHVCGTQVYIHENMHISMYSREHINIHVSTWTYIYLYVTICLESSRESLLWLLNLTYAAHMYISTWTCVYPCIYMNMIYPREHVYIHVSTWTCIYPREYVYIHVSTWTCICECIHICLDVSRESLLWILNLTCAARMYISTWIHIYPCIHICLTFLQNLYCES